MSWGHNDTGEYIETLVFEDVFGVVDAVTGTVVMAGDISELVVCSRETARRKLHSLVDRGDVSSRKTAGRVVWWLVDDHGPTRGVHAEDPFWEFEPGASGESRVSGSVDEVLYGKDAS